MERFGRFRVSVRTVPLRKGCSLCVCTSRERCGSGSDLKVPAVPVLGLPAICLSCRRLALVGRVPFTKTAANLMVRFFGRRLMHHQNVSLQNAPSKRTLLTSLKRSKAGPPQLKRSKKYILMVHFAVIRFGGASGACQVLLMLLGNFQPFQDFFETPGRKAQEDFLEIFSRFPARRASRLP